MDEPLIAGMTTAQSRALMDRTELSSVALLFYRGTIGPGNRCGHGSGVLVRVNDCYLVLTAGHCVQELLGRDVIVAIPLTAHPGRFIAKVLAAYKSDSPDCGVIELAPESAATMEAMGKNFIGLGRLALASCPHVGTAIRRIFVTGYPAAGQRRTDEGKLEISQIFLSVGAELIDPEAQKQGLLGVFVASNEVVNLFDQPGTPVPLAALAGASGGGVWIADEFTFSVASLRLLSIHVGSLDIESERRVVSVPVDAHLSLFEHRRAIRSE